MADESSSSSMATEDPKTSGGSASKDESRSDGDPTALMRQLISALEKHAGKPGESSKGKTFLHG